MKLVRVLSRLRLISLAAAAVVALTAIVGGAVRIPPPNARWQAQREQRRSGPQGGKFAEFIGAGGLVAFWTLAGRIAFRLRLAPESLGEGELILLGLDDDDVRTAKS